MMNKHKHTSRVLRDVRLLLLGGIAWLVCGIALPTAQDTGTHGLMSKVGHFVITPAFASSDKSGGSDKSDGEGSDKSSSDKSSSEGSDKSGSDSSSSTDYSTATLVCESRDAVESKLGLTSDGEGSDTSGSDKSSSESSDKSGGDKSSSSEGSDKSGSDKSSSSDSEGSDKSSSSESENSDGKVTICHIPPGNPDQRHTITVDESAVSAHMAHGDSYGACSGVTKSYIDSLPTCAAIVGAGTPTVTGVWVPETAVGDKTALNDFYTQMQSGTAVATPSEQTGNDTGSKSYREIRGQ